MDDLASRVAAAADISEDVAKSSISIILNFLNNDAPADQVKTLMDSMPGASEMMAVTPDSGKDGLMGTYNELLEAGLNMGNAPTVGKEVIAFMKEKAGAELVDGIVDSVPGLSQFV